MIRRGMFIGELILLLLLEWIAGCAKREPIVARFAREEVVTLQEFKQDVSKWKSPKVLSSVDLSELKKHLDGIINGRIKIYYAYEVGLDKDSTIIEKIKPIRHQRLLRRLWDTEIVDRIIKESDLRDFYARMGKEVVIRSIFFKLAPSAGSEEEESVKKKAGEVLRRIQAGEDFALLAREVSEDKYSAEKGGLLRSLKWRGGSDPLQKAAFSLSVGEISGLIKKDTGYYIVKVEEIRNKDRKPYKLVRDEIRRRLMEENKRRLSDEATVYWKKVMDKNRVQWCEDGLVFLWDRMRLIKNSSRDVVLDSLEVLGLEDKATALVKYRGGKITIQDFQNIINDFPQHIRIPVDNHEAIKRNVIEQWLMGEMLSDRAVKKGLDKDKVVVEGVKDVLEREMVRLMLQREVIGEINPSEDEIREYYEKKKEERYAEPERVKVQEVMVGDEKLAGQIAEWAKSGRNFDQLVRKHTERTGFKEKNGILDYFSRGQWGAIGEKAFNLRVGEIAGPIPLRNKRGYSVIKLLERKSSRTKSFDDVRERVVRDLSNEIKKEREEKWLAEKRKEYSVYVYEEVIKRAFRDES
jgi:parvulin-like peptidyl-prolyl isomerase